MKVLETWTKLLYLVCLLGYKICKIFSKKHLFFFGFIPFHYCTILLISVVRFAQMAWNLQVHDVKKKSETGQEYIKTCMLRLIYSSYISTIIIYLREVIEKRFCFYNADGFWIFVHRLFWNSRLTTLLLQFPYLEIDICINIKYKKIINCRVLKQNKRYGQLLNVSDHIIYNLKFIQLLSQFWVIYKGIN